MKILLISAFMLFYSISAFANYTTPGQGKNWDLDSLVTYSGGDITFTAPNIYLVNDTITISATDTVTIRSNAVIKMAQGSFFDINGVLKILPADSLLITAQDTTLKYLGLKFNENADGSVMKKTIMEYGNAVRMLDCDILIDSCTFRYNNMNSSFSSSSVISLFRSNSTISNCKIYRNRRSAISSGANIASSPQIINNLIYENNTDNANVPQINIGATNVTPPIVIRGNTIRGLYPMAGGISFLPIGSANIVIENNVIVNNRYGIALQNVNITGIISGNRIDSNNIQNEPNLGGSGINFNGDSTIKVIVKRNTIRNNLWGVTVQLRAKPNFGNITNADTSDNGYNYIYNNMQSAGVFDFYNNTKDSIYAQNNYWGTNSADSIEAHVVHKADIDSLGILLYTTFITISNVSGTTLTIPQGYELSNPYPNPFNPSTKFNFSLPKQSKLVIKIFDITGREVAEIFNGVKEAGTYSADFNAGNFTSGIYFIRLEAVSNTGDNFSAVKKIMLVK